MANLAWDLLAKYLNKETSDKENEQVNNWRHENAENEAFFQKMKKVWQESEREVTKATPDTDLVWQQLSEKMDEEQPVTSAGGKSVKMFPRPVISRIAATVLLMVLAGVALWYLTGNNHYIEFNTLAKADSILLPDGSQIYLNANSTLKYPRHFDGEQREVILQGEAFFEVVKNESQPFVIAAGEATITVLGTSFNLKAPENESLVSCIVLSGKVSMQIEKQENESIILERGEQGVYQNGQLQSMDFNDANAIGWYTGEFQFQNSTLGEVIQVLEKAYHQEIVLEQTVLSDCSLTATFQANDLEEMLQVITLTLGLQYEKTDEGWLIFGEGC